MEDMFSHETFAVTYKTTRNHIPEENNHHFYHRERLKCDLTVSRSDLHEQLIPLDCTPYFNFLPSILVIWRSFELLRWKKH
jgi:hypothetical protein